MSSAPSLLDMPDVAMSCILKNCGFRSIHSLRKVCCGLRNFIDDRKPEANLEGIKVIIAKEACRALYYINYINENDRKEVEFEKDGDGFKVFHERQLKRKFENEDLRTVFLAGLQLILRHQKTVLEQFNLKVQDENLEADSLRMFMSDSAAAPHLLKVKRLDMLVSNQNQFMNILSMIEPGTLKKIRLTTPYYNDYIKPEVFNEIVNSEQWKMAEELVIIDVCLRDAPIQHFKHFSSVDIILQTIDLDYVIQMKEEFLRFEKLESAHFTFQQFLDLPRIVELFGLPYRSGRVYYWYFRKTNSSNDEDKKVLCINIDCQQTLIDFSIIPKICVPSSYMQHIQN